MKADLELTAEYLERDAENIQQYANELVGADELSMGDKKLAAQHQRGAELIRSLDKTRAEVSDFGQRCEDGYGDEASAVEQIKSIAVEVAGVVGEMAAAFDIATGSTNPRKLKTAGELGKDLLKIADYLKRLSGRLSAVRLK